MKTLRKVYGYLFERSPLWSRGNIATSQAAGPGSIPGRVNFLFDVFSGFSLNRLTNVRKFGPHHMAIIYHPNYMSPVYGRRRSLTLAIVGTVHGRR